MEWTRIELLKWGGFCNQTQAFFLFCNKMLLFTHFERVSVSRMQDSYGCILDQQRIFKVYKENHRKLLTTVCKVERIKTLNVC